MKNFLVLLAGALIVLLSGCASVPMASLDQDTKAKDFSPLLGKASLYIYRNENFGGAFPMTVSVNGKTLGQTAARTYFRLNLNPGKYTITSNAENVSNLDLTVDAGMNYYVWQEVKMGMWSAGSLLQQVDESKGRAGVTESKLIASSVSDNELTTSDAPAKPSPETSTPMNESVSQKLRELESLRKDGVITEGEFQKKKQQLLEKF
ncbi:MAG: DUF2846 domain-containing protein [Gallionella sp.]